MAKAGQVRIGISGWRYKGWRGVFYPEKLAQRRELAFAAEQFPSVELNGSFYSLQRPKNYRQWRDETPTDFVFAIKGSRYLTHMLKLKEPEQPLANFMASGLLELGPKLGPILWQFAPQMRFDEARFRPFFELLPKTQGELAGVARGRNERLEGRESLVAELPKAAVRHCVEIRHESFACPEFIALLREFSIGLVVADTVEWPLLMDVTADFVYCRLHGSEQLYASGYGTEALTVWADRVVSWATGVGQAGGRYVLPAAQARAMPRDVYVYFDNDAKVRAPADAKVLTQMVSERLASTDGAL